LDYNRVCFGRCGLGNKFLIDKFNDENVMLAEFLTIDEVADYLKVDYQLVYKLIRGGKMSAVRLGRIYRVRCSDLEEFICNNMTGVGLEFAVCASCGGKYDSKRSLVHICSEANCDGKLCYDCWHRLGLKSCKVHCA